MNWLSISKKIICDGSTVEVGNHEFVIWQPVWNQIMCEKSDYGLEPVFTVLINVWKIWVRKESECWYRSGLDDQSESRMDKEGKKAKRVIYTGRNWWAKEWKVSNEVQGKWEWNDKAPDRINVCNQEFEILEFNISEFE